LHWISSKQNKSIQVVPFYSGMTYNESYNYPLLIVAFYITTSSVLCDSPCIVFTEEPLHRSLTCHF